MSAQAEALVTSWEPLPAEALERVLTHLSGDVLALCAAACVSRAWRDAAAVVEPLSAVRLERLPAVVARRLTDAGLAALVRRSHGRLEYLDLCGACLLTDAGLVAALDVGGAGLVTDAGLIAGLLQPHALYAFRSDAACHFITASGVARALASQRGLMHELCVRGLDCLQKPGPEQAVRAWRGECVGVINELYALMAPRGRLVGAQICSVFSDDADPNDEPCAGMCGPDDVCQGCGVVLCEDHQDFSECGRCDQLFCARVRRAHARSTGDDARSSLALTPRHSSRASLARHSPAACVAAHAPQPARAGGLPFGGLPDGEASCCSPSRLERAACRRSGARACASDGRRALAVRRRVRGARVARRCG